MIASSERVEERGTEMEGTSLGLHSKCQTPAKESRRSHQMSPTGSLS